MEDFGYVAIYGGKRIEVYASSLYAAKKKAISDLRVPKSKIGLLSVILAEYPDGTQVVGATD